MIGPTFRKMNRNAIGSMIGSLAGSIVDIAAVKQINSGFVMVWHKDGQRSD
jgi:hypothetical protein